MPDFTPEKRIRADAPREDALRGFREAVNQPNTMFSTDHWLLPKLERLCQLLHDPITGGEAAALRDVLYERRWMKDLLEWLQGEQMSWPNFFVHRKFLEEKAEQERRERLRKADEEWAQGIRKPNRFGDLLPTDAEDLASDKKRIAARSEAMPSLRNAT